MSAKSCEKTIIIDENDVQEAEFRIHARRLEDSWVEGEIVNFREFYDSYHFYDHEILNVEIGLENDAFMFVDIQAVLKKRWKGWMETN